MPHTVKVHEPIEYEPAIVAAVLGEDALPVNVTDGGTGTTITKYQPRRRNTGSAGIPITPEYAQYLLMGALRTDLDGN